MSTRRCRRPQWGRFRRTCWPVSMRCMKAISAARNALAITIAEGEVNMFTRIDHVMICVPDLAQGIEQYRKLGFNIHAGGVHTGKGTHNAIAFNQDDYLELLAIRDQAEYKISGGRSNIPGGTLPEFIVAGGGIRYVV